MTSILLQLDQQSQLLFETCVSFETLRLKQKPQEVQDEIRLRLNIEKIKLQQRQDEEKSFEVKYLQGLSRARNTQDTEEDLVQDIEDLKAKLYKVSLEKQQNRLFAYRLKSNGAFLERLLDCNNPQIRQLVNQRDELAKTTVALRKTLKEKSSEKLQCQVICSQLQAENRRILRTVKAQKRDTDKENSSKSRQKPQNLNKQEIEEKKHWLKHLLTGLALEAKVNWAKDLSLRRHILR